MKKRRSILSLLAFCIMAGMLAIPASASSPAGVLPSATARAELYQSLDFGSYPIDFLDGAIVDDTLYSEGEFYGQPGDHTVYYKENGAWYKRPLYLYKVGDVNCDNTVNVVDLVALKKNFAGKRALGKAATRAADTNLDKTADADDLSQLKTSVLAGEAFPVTGYNGNMENLVDFTVDVESGRDIRVLQLTDPQIIEKEQMHAGRTGVADRWSKNYKDEEYRNYVRKTITEYDPDFIFITGDVVYGEFDDSGEALIEFISFMDGFKIPWAPVFGNHDQESAKGANWQCRYLSHGEYCLFKQRTLTGNGNYTVGLRQDGVYKRVFFMLDSNGCGSAHANSLSNNHTKTSAGFGNDQIEWFTALAEQMRYAQPGIHLSAAFHIQFYAFGDAFAQYGFTNSNTINNPINVDAIEDAAETDFGYLGRDLKGPWDQTRDVFYGMKSAGFDSFFVGHEHCNSASVVYRGIRFQYGLKSSTYDRANYLNANGTVTGTYDKPANPIVGGTAVPLNADGSLGQPYCIYYAASSMPKEPDPPLVVKGKDVYDFNGTDFDTSYQDSGVCASGFVCNKLTDLSGVPSGYSGGVYGRANNGSSGMATVAIGFEKALDLSKVAALKLQMYVPSHSLTSGKSALLRMFSGEDYSTLQYSGTFTAVGGKYDQWVEIDLLPLLRSRSGAESTVDILADNTLQKFFVTYRFYSSDTTAMCYYDSLTVEYTDENYFVADPSEQIAGADVYDFNGTDFGMSYVDTGICATNFICSKISDLSTVPTGYTGSVYGRKNYDSAGMATVAVDLGTLDVTKIASVKVRMYVPSHSLTSGKSALLRLFDGEVYDGHLQFEGKFTEVGGKYDGWVEIDLLPLLKARSGANAVQPIIRNDQLGKFYIVYRFYSSDTTAICYFDKITVEYTDAGYRIE